MHVLDDERLVAAEVSLDALILRGHVEEGRIEIGGVPRVARLQPLGVVGANERIALGPREVDGAEPRGGRLVARADDEALRVLDVGERV